MPEFEQERKQFAEVYAKMADEELEAIANDASELTEGARQALQNELSRRGVNLELSRVEEQVAPEFSELVSIQMFRDLPQALLAKGKLDSAGIENHLIDENMVRMDWFISNLLGGVKLCVKPEDAEEALTMLEEAIPNAIELEDDIPFDQPQCPNCQSLDLSSEGVASRAGFVSAWIGFPLPLKRKSCKCLACGHVWKPEAQPQS